MVLATDPLLENRQDSKDDLDDDEEETLSFCDLPFYEDAEKVDRSLSSSSDDYHEPFEFSIEDFPASNHEAESIIFCGKLILYRDQPAAPTTQKQSSNKKTIFMHKSSSGSGSSSGKSRLKGHNKNQQVATEVSMLASPAKSRWYLYMFGLARFPVEMKLRDIKNRQSRRSPAPMFQSQGNSGEVISKSRGRGFWGLLRALGCKSSHHATTMVKSFTCI